MKRNLSAISKTILHSVVFFLSYILLDYYNIPTKLHIDISQINTDFLSITANVSIAIIIFALGYYLIEQWNLRKLQNQKATAEIFLCSIYEECLDSIKLLDMPTVVQTLFLQTDPNENYNALDHLSPVMKYSQITFMNESQLMSYFESGVLSPQQFQLYLSIKSSYCHYVTRRILAFDRPELCTKKREQLVSLLNLQISMYSHKKEGCKNHAPHHHRKAV